MAKTSHGRHIFQNEDLRGCRLFLVVVIMVFCGGVLGGRTGFGEEIDIKKHLKLINKPAIKTIKSEDGDIIDCVDIYKQPAFEHPSIINHTLQVRPSNYYQTMNGSTFSSTAIRQIWRKSGSCPDGTIPIRRTRKSDLLRVMSFKSYGRKTPQTTSTVGHESAVVMTMGEFYGASAKFNIWNPHVEPKEFSSSKLNILSDGGLDASIIQVGWIVHPPLFGDNRTRIFTYWTGDGFNKTGCFNLICSGFVQTSKEIVLGGTLDPLSTYGGSQYLIDLVVYKDPLYKQWWLLFEGNPIGYWPTSIFQKLEHASIVEWGGEIFNSGNEGKHTTTQMGSGHFPTEGYQKSSFFKNILIVDFSNEYWAPQGVVPVIDKPACYDIKYNGTKWGKDPGFFFYYGGPGHSATCS